MDRRLPLLGLVALIAGIGVFLALHVLPPTNDINPMRRTLSEYALGDHKWAFDLAVVLIALGSALAFAELLRRGRGLVPKGKGAGGMGAVGMGAVGKGAVGMGAVGMGAVWTVSLLVVVVFTKTNWSVGPSLGGTIHRYASVAAFLSLPVAVLLATGAVFPAAAGWRWLTRLLSLGSLAWFGTIVVGVVNMAMGGVSWWRFLPLGLVERMIAGFAVAGLAVLVFGLIRGSAHEPASASPPVDVPH